MCIQINYNTEQLIRERERKKSNIAHMSKDVILSKCILEKNRIDSARKRVGERERMREEQKSVFVTCDVNSVSGTFSETGFDFFFFLNKKTKNKERERERERGGGGTVALIDAGVCRESKLQSQ